MDPLVTLFVGHRGVGKSSLLKELERLSTVQAWDWVFIDLDDEMVKREGETIERLFSRGERAFRALEADVLDDLVRKAQYKTFIAVGAGFEGPPPHGSHVVWIRRLTDRSGRVFSDRPRLNQDLSPFEEYGARYEVRNRRYSAWAHEQLMIPEGLESGASLFFNEKNPIHVPFALTVLRENVRSWSSFWNRRRNWGLRYVELRDDLLSSEEINRLLSEIPPSQVLLSRRKADRQCPHLNVRTDWALELGPPPDSNSFILSLHERDGHLSKCFARLNSYPCEIEKLAIQIHSFTELMEGHEWWRQAPHRRAFLPMSEMGRWRWYRSLFGPSMPIHFFREGEGSAPDQPLLLQTLLQAEFSNKFAAILGSPVDHSRTPMEHRSTFGFPVVAIDVNEGEFDEALLILRKLGLKAAAVTAPLKTLAAAAATHRSSDVLKTNAANTLWLEDDAIHAHNTDLLALQQLKTETPGHSVWLWGGGGIKKTVKAVWPEAREISARAGTSDEGQPDLLIWAVGRSRDFKWPSENVKPKQVLDLNYSDDSPGLEWAIMRGIPYQSGLRMFKLQAEYQRQFWRKWGSL